jgi:polysaccharide export outer membrane protein
MPSSLIRFASIVAVLLTAEITGGAQGLNPRTQPVAPAMTPGMQPGGERMAAVDPDKKLSAGDQVTVEIIEDREGGLPRVVTATGELDVPPLGRVKVSGKTAGQAAADIKQLLEREYYYTATVRLSIDAVSRFVVRSGVVYLSGEVRMVGPQEIVAGENFTLTNAILKAGGLGAFGDGKKVRLMRQKNGNTETSVINYLQLIERGDATNDPVLKDGDRIFVPKVWIKF